MRKKSLILCGLCLTAILGGMALDGNINAVEVSAEENFISIAEDYTESDYLLLSNGSTSLSRTIRDFSTDTKNAYSGADCSEITQVIPRQCLESTETSAVYQHNGAEYGFYMVKEGNFFDLLLIDFVYEFENGHESDIEYKIRIEPILQQSFIRSQTSTGSYEWQKYDNEGERYTYYVANPRFYTYIQNENDLNYGDVGYSMDYDNGVIILQSRVNYGKISYKTETDLLGDVLKIAGEKLLDGAVAKLDTVSGGVASVVKQAIETDLDIYEEGTETIINTNNENNIFTEQSKTKQFQSGCPYYSRSAAFLPKEEIVLSADIASYAEFITVLSDASYKTRLTEICDFDIVKRRGMYSSMEQVAGPSEGKAFSFHQERILFENQPPIFEFSQSDFENTTIPLYILPSGKQRISFSPAYSGIYSFPVITNTDIKIISDTGNLVASNNTSIRLEGGRLYYIDIVNNSQNTISGQHFTCTLQEIGSELKINLNGFDEYIIKYNSLAEKMYKVHVNNSNCDIKILNESFEMVKESTSNNCYYEFKQNTYYILLTNNLESAVEVDCTLEQPTLYQMDQEHQIHLNNEEMFIRFETTNADSYYLEFMFNGELTYQGCTIEVFQETADTEINKNWTFVYVNSSQSVCFGFVGTGTVSFKFEKDENDYQWEINGVMYPTTYINNDAEFINSNKIVVRRGTELEIKLKAGDVYFNKLEKLTIYEGYSFYGGILTIDSDCQLTNSTASNMLGLESAYKAGSIAKLQIQVINDISSISVETYINNSSYGFDYSEISNVAGETVNLTFQIVSPTSFNSKTIQVEGAGGTYNLKSYIESEIKYTDMVDFYISIKEIEIVSAGGPTIIYSTTKEIYQQISSIENIRCHRYFESGNGTSSSPFVISNERHLRNIQTPELLCTQLNTNTDTTDDRHFYYILNNDIVINDTSNNVNYVACETFWGILELDYNTISLTNTNISVGKNYGFILTNNGEIRNGHFAPYLQTATGGGSTTYNIGVVCAVNNGTIDKIYIDHTTGRTQDIYIRGWYFYFGTIAGTNYGTIRNCVNYATIRGNCVNFGGIVGWNGGDNNYMYSCTNRGDIYAETRGTISAGVGGVVGLAGEGSKIEQPYNAGDLLFDYNNSTSRITVYMGQIAGRMCEADTLIDAYCGGSAAIKSGVTVDTSYVSNGAVGMYFASSKVEEDDSCVVAGTLITLADGRQVPVETLTGNEMLLVWNLHTGSFDVAPILFIDHDAAAMYKIINLQFSDGTQVKVIYEHALWDFNLNKYVFLREDAAQYVGHWFNKQTTDANGNMIWTRVQLTNVTITEEYTTAWSPVTYGHLCIYVNGMLSMPGATEGLINIFEVDGDTMRIDQEQYLADIAMYGMFTYEEFAKIYPIPETIFEAFGGEYLKVSMGKGLIDYETLGELIERYSEFFE